MKKLELYILLFVIILPIQIFGQPNEKEKMDAFVSKLIDEMTLEEKLGQLNLLNIGSFTTGLSTNPDIYDRIKRGKVGGLFNIKSVEKISELQKISVEETRLKIPMIFGMDVVHGYETIFPIPLGLASSWDMNLIEQSARIAAQEASADGINWTFAPVVDIARDPRWGRIAEGSGEDVFLGSQIAQAMVHGFQGSDLSQNNTMMACVKHYALYGAAEAGRDYNTTDMSRIRMYNEYLPPYKAAIDAGAGSIMASFNDVDGIPATANKWLQTEVLRNQWGFKGLVVSDYTGVSEMVDHGLGNLQQVSALALKAGVNMDMVSEGYLNTLEKSLKEGKVTLEDINQSVRKILEAKYKLGLFDNPYRYCDLTRAKAEIFSPANRAIARGIASQSMVLMENVNHILPLKKSGTIAVIGPLADDAENMPGTWSVAAIHSKAITLLKGIKEAVGSEAKILYARGSNVDDNPELSKIYLRHGRDKTIDSRSGEEMLKEAIEIASQSDVIILAVGEASEMSGEASSRVNIEIPEIQKKLLTELKGTGKPIIVVLFTGRPLILKQEKEQANAILNVWFAGSEAGYAISDVLFGKVNPCGKIPVTFPRSLGQVPIYYSFKNTGRPLTNAGLDNCKYEEYRSTYMDECNTPLYPFGYGLSYTTFEYKNLKLSDSILTNDGKLLVSVDVTNCGEYDGAEVVQLYVRDLVGSITRPVKELKGFQKVFLKKGDACTVNFELTEKDLRFYNNDLQFASEPGEFVVFVGTNSNNTHSRNFTLQK